MSKKPIKSSLFRFVTLRSPQTIEDKENRAGLILPNDVVKGNSVYYQAVSEIAHDEYGKKTALTDAAFTPFENKTAVKSVSTRMATIYNFSVWLMRNKDYLTYESVAANLPKTYLDWDSDSTESSEYNITLQHTEETQLWDNLLYQTVNKTSIGLREACIQMLIANSFVKAFKAFHDVMIENLLKGDVEFIVFTDQDRDEFTKRANASVVIEKEVLLSNREKETVLSDNLPTSKVKTMNTRLSLQVAQKSLNALKATLGELDREEEVYKVENQAKYKTDLVQHEAEVKALIDKAEPTMVLHTDPETGKTSEVETYPNLDIPKFDFEPLAINFQNSDDLFPKKSTEDNFLSDEATKILRLESFYGYKDFSSIKKAIKNSVKEHEKVISNLKSQLKSKTRTLGGNKVILNPEREKNTMDYCFTGLLRETKGRYPSGKRFRLFDK